MTHDPRLEPQVGDLLERGGISREVLAVEPDLFAGFAVTFRTQISVAVVGRIAWALWARGARVLTRSEPSTTCLE